MRGISALVVALLLSAGSAFAADREGTRALAKIEFDAARAAFDAGLYPEALERFQRAYALAPFPDLLYDIGRCHERMGDRAAAIEAYDRYLAVTPPSADREDLVQHVARLRGALLEGGAVGGNAGATAGATTTGAAPTIAAPAASRPTPIHRRWWFWTTLGVAVGAAVGIGVGVGVGAQASSSPLTFPALRASP